MGVYDHEPEINSGKYFKPVSGTAYSLKVCSEPVIFQNVFEDPVKGPQVSTKYAWIVYNQTDGLPQIFQLPPTGFLALKAIAQNPKWGDPTNGKYDISYTKTGEKKDTKHTLMPEPADGPLTPEQVAEAGEIDLVESIAAGKGAQSVMWLSEYENGAAKTAPRPRDHVTEVTDEPINLDDIPF